MRVVEDGKPCVALIGGAGQLGNDLQKALDATVVAHDLPDFDVRDELRVRNCLEAYGPELVINCAALTDVDGCEEDAQAAFQVNALGALHVARAAAAIHADLIHVSTDYVFGGEEDRLLPYTESDRPQPLNVYGASKLAGEQLSLACHPRALVVRTASLYGHTRPRGKAGNFVETMLRLVGQGQALRVVNDQRMSPTSTRACARQIAALAAARAVGIWHVAATDTCTWYEFARGIFAHMQMDVAVQPVSSAEYPRRARRPRFCALSSERPAPPGIDAMPGWREMLCEYLETRPMPCDTRPPTTTDQHGGVIEHARG